MTQKPEAEPEAKALEPSRPNDEFRLGLIECLPALKRFSMILCRDQPACDDLVQATCERALARWQQFQLDTRLQSWLFSIMHSIRKNKLRRNRNQRNAYDKLRYQTPYTDGERDVFGKIELSEVLSALKDMPPDQAAAITLVSLDGLSYREAADILDIPQGTLESRIARGRIALGKQLESKTVENKQRQDNQDNSFERKSRRST